MIALLAGLAFGGALEDALAEERLEEKVKLFVVAKPQIEARLSSGDRVQALTDLARLWEDMAHAILHTEPPGHLQPDQVAVFTLALWERAVPLCAQARAAWSAAIEASPRRYPRAERRRALLDPARLEPAEPAVVERRVAGFLGPYPKEPAPEPTALPAGEVGVLAAQGDSAAMFGDPAVLEEVRPAPAPAGPPPREALARLWAEPETRACFEARDW